MALRLEADAGGRAARVPSWPTAAPVLRAWQQCGGQSPPGLRTRQAGRSAVPPFRRASVSSRSGGAHPRRRPCALCLEQRRRAGGAGAARRAARPLRLLLPPHDAKRVPVGALTDGRTRARACLQSPHAARLPPVLIERACLVRVDIRPRHTRRSGQARRSGRARRSGQALGGEARAGGAVPAGQGGWQRDEWAEGRGKEWCRWAGDLHTKTGG